MRVLLSDDDTHCAVRRVLSMHHGGLTPVFVGLRTGLHVLLIALVMFVIVRTAFVPGDAPAAVIGVAVLLLATYAAGGLLAGHTASRAPLLRWLWLTFVTLEWLVLVWMTPEAAYVVFPLFFLYLHLLERRAGTIAVAGVTAIAVVALGVHIGWSAGGVIGPVVGACVAIMIGLGYQTLAREASERERLMTELLATRDQLVASEHESGVLAERSRLAREIHDTLAQGLASIQMLLHAAERVDPASPGTEHVRLARETAATNLADARRFIRELTPANLEDAGLGAALRRLAETQWEPQGITVNVRMSDSPPLPMHLQTALLRIAQGALANVIQHADATTATIKLTNDPEALHFSVADDGRGFDTDVRDSSRPIGATDSFGLRATQERVDQLGGVLTVTSAPGRGTVLMVDLSRADVA